MTKNPDKKDEKPLSNVRWFIGFAVLCSLITLGAMCFANHRLELTHSIIIKHQTKSIECLDSLISIYRSFQNDSTYISDSDTFKQLNYQLLVIAKSTEENNRNDRIGNLLESELAKIQNEYEVLNLWCALLTVVFLIFSFFSIFKTNEMANQSEDALKTMREIERDVQKKSESIDQKIKDADTKIDNLTKSISDLETQLNKLTADVNNIKDKDITEIQNQLDGFKAVTKEIDDVSNNAKRELNNLSDDLKKKLKDEAKSSIKDLGPTIIDMVKSNYDENAKTLISRIEGVEKSLAKLLEDLSELTKDNVDKDAIAAEEADESNTDADDEDIPNDPAGKEYDA